MANEFYVRPYSPTDDYYMVAEWWLAHGHPVVPVYHLPPTGFISGFDGIDMVAMWLRYDSHAPVCFLAHIVSLPGLSVRATIGASRVGVEACKKRAIQMGVDVMSVYAPRAIVRILEHMDFKVDERELVNGSCNLKEVSCLS